MEADHALQAISLSLQLVVLITLWNGFNCILNAIGKLPAEPTRPQDPADQDQQD